MQLKLIRKLPIYDSKGNMTFIEGDITLADLSLRDYVSYKFKYLGKSVWTFRSDLLNAINEYNYHSYDIDSSVGFPGFSIYLFDKQVVAKVLRASEVDLTLDDGSIIPIDSLSYGVIREKTIEVPIDKQMILRNGVHTFHKARIVTTRELPNLMKHLDKFDELAFDSETIGLLQEIYKLDDREDFLVSISVSTDANSGYYIRATKTKEFRDFLKFLCTKHLIIHNAHFDVGMLKAVYGLVPKSFDDTLIMAKLMNENLLSYKLKDLATQVLGRGKQLKLNEFDYLTYLHTGNFDQIEYILAYYAAADTANTYGLYSYTIPKLKAQSELYKYYTDIEIKSIVPVSIAILENGLKVDKESLQNLSEQSETKLNELLSQMETIAQPYIDNINNEYLKEQEQARLDYWQEVFNDFVSRGIFSTQLEVNITKEMILNTNADNLPPFGSIKKLATYHNRLSAKPQGVNQYSLDLSNKKFMELLVYSSPHGFRLPLQTSKAGNASLNKASISELEKYLHTQVTTGNVELIQVQEFFNAFKEYTRIRKLLDAFITPTLESINTYKDGKLHANYNLLGTVSSRASCNNPNFQQLSNHKDLDVRRCFVVDDSSYSFLQFDYEAQELRVMAALSQDPLLIELIKNNRDLHSETVRRVWPELASCTDEEIKTIHKDKRNIAKTILFSLNC